MKKETIAILCLSLSAPAVLSQETTPAAVQLPAPAAAQQPAKPSPEEIKAVVSYFLGYQTGRELSGEGLLLEDIDADAYMRAMTDAFQSKVDPDMRDKDLDIYMSTFADNLRARSEALAAKNLEIGNAFLKENAEKEGVATTPTGLQYKVLTPANGRTYDAEKDGRGAEATFTYEGRLIDGTVFDSTPSDEPATMAIDRVIPGMTEALTMMPIGAEWEVYIPAELGYGAQSLGSIGPNSTLIFKIKLIDIKPKKGSPENPIQLTPEMMQQLQEQGLEPVQMPM